MPDIRERAARYYDLQDNPTDDVPFYRRLVPSPRARVLELGCGTGRVLLPLSRACGYVHGVDSSPAMLRICREKLRREGIPESRARATPGDITELNLGATFDLVIAPFRVFQNLAADAQVDGFFATVRRHLAPGGTAVVNTFRPNGDPEAIRLRWSDPAEHLEEEVALAGGGRLVKLNRRARHTADPLVLHPDLIYRRYSAGGALEDEVVLAISMRCWYPDELERTVTDHGFRVLERWGGYRGEPWGEGPELVVRFAG